MPHGYEGYWREKSDKKEGVIAVKKEKGNYFLNKINVFTGKEESLLLSEKDGALSINTGIGKSRSNFPTTGKSCMSNAGGM